MQQIAITAQLRDGAEERARELVAAGPPFDPASVGLVRHDVFVSHSLVVFVFEGEGVERHLSDLLNDAPPLRRLDRGRRSSKSRHASRTRPTTGTPRRTP